MLEICAVVELATSHRLLSQQHQWSTWYRVLCASETPNERLLSEKIRIWFVCTAHWLFRSGEIFTKSRLFYWYFFFPIRPQPREQYVCYHYGYVLSLRFFFGWSDFELGNSARVLLRTHLHWILWRGYEYYLMYTRIGILESFGIFRFDKIGKHIIFGLLQTRYDNVAWKTS